MFKCPPNKYLAPYHGAQVTSQFDINLFLLYLDPSPLSNKNTQPFSNPRHLAINLLLTGSYSLH